MAKGQGRSSGQGVKLYRLRDYFYRYTNKDNPKGRETIRDALKSMGVKASAKTLYNDICLLREMGIPIEYNASKWGYYVSKPQFEPQELLMLLDCIRYAKFITAEESDRLAEKVRKLGTVYDEQALADAVQEEKVVYKADRSVYENIPVLLDAIRQGRKIRFNLLSPVADRRVRRETAMEAFVVSPHRLALVNGTYILFFTPEQGDLERFRDLMGASLDRRTEEEIRLMEEYEYGYIDASMMADIKILLSPSIYSFTGSHRTMRESEENLTRMFGPRCAVTIRFSDRVMERVATELSGKAVLLPAEWGYFETSIIVWPNDFFFEWVASFGRYAEITAPEDVVEAYARFEEEKLPTRKHKST